MTGRTRFLPRLLIASLVAAGVVAVLLAACSPSDGGSAGTSADDATAPGDGGASADRSSDEAPADGSSSSDAEILDAAAPPPPTGDPLRGLTLRGGWEAPRALPAPVNTSGWEDCAYVSASGHRLYFAYTRWDYDDTSRGTVVVDGPARPGAVRAAFEIYEATIADGGWVVSPSTANSDSGAVAEAAEGVDDTEESMAFIRYDYDAPNAGDIYLAKKAGGVWSTAQKLGAPINTACVEDNAALSRDGTRLYFDSNRADDLGTTCKATSGVETRTIYVSTLVGGVWSAPVPIVGAPNGGLFHWQVYPREDPVLYWIGHESDCGSDECVYRAELVADGGYGNESVVAQPTPTATAAVGEVVGIGEVSITRDGHWMYFVYIVKTGTTDGGMTSNLDIGVAYHP